MTGCGPGAVQCPGLYYIITTRCVCVSDGKVRLATLELSCLLLKQSVLSGSQCIIKDIHLACLEVSVLTQNISYVQRTSLYCYTFCILCIPASLCQNYFWSSWCIKFKLTKWDWWNPFIFVYTYIMLGKKGSEQECDTIIYINYDQRHLLTSKIINNLFV